MNKNSLYLIFIVVLLGFNVFLVLKIKKLKQQQNEAFISIQNEKISEIDAIESQENSTYYNLEVAFKSEHLSLKKDLKVINHKLDTLPLSEVVDQGRIVYNYSETHCEMCINAELDLIKQISSNEYDRVIVLINYQEIRNLVIEKRKLQRLGLDNLQIYLLSKPLQLPVENIGFPYYFYLDETMKTQHVFIPYKHFPSLSQDYLQTTLENFF